MEFEWSGRLRGWLERNSVFAVRLSKFGSGVRVEQDDEWVLRTVESFK